MKRSSLFSLVVLGAVGATAHAQSFYDNTVFFQGQGVTNGGAAVDPALATNTITRLNADDIYAPNGAGLGVFQYSFNVVNFNTAATSARALVRFYSVDATTGLPATFLGGSNFNAIAFTAGSATTYSTALSATPYFTIPTNGRFWAGITFDNNSGATGATVTTLNNLGSGLFNPPLFGGSQDLFFQSTTNGGFVSNNPAGGTFNFTGGTPVANFGFRFAGATGFTAVPEPASMAALGLGALALLRRRRNKSA